MTDYPALYLVRAGENGEDEEYALDHGLAIIGFNEVPSLENAKSYNDVSKMLEKAYPDKRPRALANYAGQVAAFVLSMENNDLVILPRKLTPQVAIGKVIGPYEYRKINGESRHVRKVKWLRPDIPRTEFKQDLLFSFGAFMTICNITRNDAERRVNAILDGKTDPGFAGEAARPAKQANIPVVKTAEETSDLAVLANDQVVRHIQSNFSGHDLSRLVDSVLMAEGWVTKFSPPGADGGVDILAGRGSLGLEAPRLCVQVKSQPSPADVTIYRTLQGTMQTFQAQQGLLVCWGGFNRAVQNEARQGYFSVRLWDSSDLVAAVYRNYDRLPPEIQAGIPLKQVWMLVPDDSAE